VGFEAELRQFVNIAVMPPPASTLRGAADGATGRGCVRGDERTPQGINLFIH